MNQMDACCTVSCERPLDQIYWNNQYASESTGWDLGMVSPPIRLYIDPLRNKDLRILIPGCGNTYEAEYLLEQGFTDITLIDIAPLLVDRLKQKFAASKEVKVVLGDFFEHQGEYDLILEQTFFCALPPTMRQHYVAKMHQLLANDGKLAGVLFNRDFEQSPPFGGSLTEYEQLFKGAFNTLHMELCRNSAAPRSGSELFIQLSKNEDVLASMYQIEGITCTGCMQTVLAKLNQQDEILNASMNTSFSQLLLVSKQLPSSEIFNSHVSSEGRPIHFSKII